MFIKNAFLPQFRPSQPVLVSEITHFRQSEEDLAASSGVVPEAHLIRPHLMVAVRVVLPPPRSVDTESNADVFLKTSQGPRDKCRLNPRVVFNKWPHFKQFHCSSTIARREAMKQTT